MVTVCSPMEECERYSRALCSGRPECTRFPVRPVARQHEAFLHLPPLPPDSDVTIEVRATRDS